MRAFRVLSRSEVNLASLTVVCLIAVCVEPLDAQRAGPGRYQHSPAPFALWSAAGHAAGVSNLATSLVRPWSPEFSVTGLPGTGHVTQANWVVTICTPYLTVWEPEEQEAKHFIVRRTTSSPTAPGDTVALDNEPVTDDPECEGGTSSELTMPLTPGFNYMEIGTCGGYQTYWGTGEFDPDQWDIGCIQRDFYSYWYDDPSKTYGASVTPATSSVTHVGSSFPKSVYTQFTVTDDANTDQEVQVSITCTGVASGCAFTIGGGTSKIIALINGAPQTFGLSYQVSAAGSGTIKFVAAAYGGPAFADTGVLNITGTASGGGGPISINMHDPNPGVNISRGACLSLPAGRNVSVECGDVRIVQPIHPTMTMNQQRAPALTYLSRHATPGSVLAVDVTISDTTINADTLLLVMNIPDKDTVSYRAPWNPAWDDGQARRVTLPFNAAAKNVTTGVHTYGMEVWALKNGVPIYSTPLAGDTLVVVDRSASPFGTGWWLSGLEELRTDTLSALSATKRLWIGSDGTTRVYTRQSDTTVWIVTPTLDRPDTLRRVDSSGTTLWRRALGNGAYVQFDNAGQHVATVNDLGHRTRFVHSAGKLDSVVLPIPSGSNAVPAYRFKYATFGPARLDTVLAPNDRTSSTRKTNVARTQGVITAFSVTGGGGATYSASTSGSTAGRINSITDGPSFTWSTAGNVVTAFAHTGLGTTNLCPVEGAGICSSVVLSGSASTSIDGGRSDVGDTTRIWHTRYGAPRQIQDAFANSTVIYRENATFPMLVTKVVRPSGFTTRTTYTSRGLVDSSIAVSPLGTSDSAKTRYTWHSTFNRVTQIVEPTGDTKTFAYDTLGLMTSWEDGRGSSTRTDFGYDAARRLQYVEPPGHASNQRYRVAYDSYLGNVWRDTTPLGFVTETLRDSAGRAVKIIAPIDSNPGSGIKSLREIGYNAWNCVDSLKNKWNGSAATYAFASISGTVGTVNLATYNQCIGPDLVDADISHYGYVTTRNPYGRAPCAGVTCTYDNAGNVITLTTSAGTVNMSYDAANRLSKRFTVEVKDTVRKFPGAEGYASPLDYGLDFPALGVKFPYYPTVGDTLIIPADTAVYTYDADGNLLTAYNRDARIKRSYYPNGAIKTDSLRIRTYTITGTPDNDFNTNVYGIKYEYDLAGRRTAMQVPTNLGHGCTPGHATQCTQTYHYVGHLGAVDTITTHRGHKFAATYDDKGRITSRTAPGGVDLTLAYDLDDRLVRRRERRNAGADTVHLDSLWYDARGKINKAVLKGTADPYQLARFAYDQHGYIAAAEFVGADTINHVFTHSNKGSITDLVKQMNLAEETCRADTYDEDGRIVGQVNYVCSDPDLFYSIDFSAAAGPIVLKSALQYEIDGDTTMTGLGYESAAWHQTDGKLRFFR